MQSAQGELESLYLKKEKKLHRLQNQSWQKGLEELCVFLNNLYFCHFLKIGKKKKKKRAVCLLFLVKLDCFGSNSLTILLKYLFHFK